MDNVFILIHAFAAIVAGWCSLCALNESTHNTPLALRSAFAMVSVGSYALLLHQHGATAQGASELVILTGVALSFVGNRRRNRRQSWRGEAA